jgi:hypothetical protein
MPSARAGRVLAKLTPDDGTAAVRTGRGMMGPCSAASRAAPLRGSLCSALDAVCDSAHRSAHGSIGWALLTTASGQPPGWSVRHRCKAPDRMEAHAIASRAAKSRFMLRLSPELHDALRAKAQEQGVSLNQWLVTVLAGTVSFQPAPAPTEWPGSVPRGVGSAGRCGVQRGTLCERWMRDWTSRRSSSPWSTAPMA